MSNFLWNTLLCNDLLWENLLVKRQPIHPFSAVAFPHLFAVWLYCVNNVYECSMIRSGSVLFLIHTNHTQ